MMFLSFLKLKKKFYLLQAFDKSYWRNILNHVIPPPKIHVFVEHYNREERKEYIKIKKENEELKDRNRYLEEKLKKFEELERGDTSVDDEEGKEIDDEEDEEEEEEEEINDIQNDDFRDNNNDENDDNMDLDD